MKWAFDKNNKYFLAYILRIDKDGVYV